jgi:rhodanese-related sulfurtransferase
MTIFPLALSDILGHWLAYAVYALIGFGFGYVLEIAGFGKSTKLAAQFYFTEMTVLKVMFTGIIVAMVLVFLATAIGLLDYNLIWVNPTYLYPGIVGGLVMGVGFILGGFCPGTSLVSAATGKIDGMFFVGGVFFGIFLFGESVGFYEGFWNSSYMGRLTLMDVFNLSTGVVVLLVVVMALAAFGMAEWSEKGIGKMDLAQFGRWRYAAAGGIVLVAVVVLLIGQPDNARRWQMLAGEQQPRIDERAIYAHPGEILDLMADPKLNVYLIDIRSETDYNLFHLLDAVHIPAAKIEEATPSLQFQPSNTVFVLMGNDEAQATDAFKTLVAASVPNVYVLEGGVNNWLSTFSDDDFRGQYALTSYTNDTFAYTLPSALGSRYPAADPNPDVFELNFTPVVELEIKRGPSSGGCG